MGETKSLNEGPAFRVSLKRVTGRARLGGSCGSDDCGESMVVANVRIRDLETFRTVVVDSRHRERGIEAAIMSLIVLKTKGKGGRRRRARCCC